MVVPRFGSVGRREAPWSKGQKRLPDEGEYHRRKVNTGRGRGPLEGITVVEFGHVIAGPFAATILADLGAHVIKLENSAHPDEARTTGPHFFAGQSLYYLALNWGKQSIAIDLTHPSGKRLAFELAAGADVVLDNFRAGAMAAFGIDHDSLAASNPAIITCSITGFGETGPYSTRPGYDYTIQALSGVMSLTGEPDSPPTRIGIAIADHTGGIAAALAICATLVERERTGQGRHIDLSLLDVQVSMLTYLAAWHLNAGAQPGRTPNSSHASLVPAQNFATEDGFVSLFVGNDGMWQRLVRELGDPELENPGFATNSQRLEHREQVVERVQSRLTQRPTDYWVEHLNGAGVACSAIKTVAQTLSDPQVAARDLISSTANGQYGSYRHVAGPLASMGTAGERAAPQLGGDTESILRMLGYDARRIAELAAEGAIKIAAPISHR
jgi:crotonobetainyl-CoA:carnitine CoA-transferase CaiB-like acyl-CoA transferase